MNTEILAAAVLVAGFVGAGRLSLHSGRLDDTLREKFVEYYVFVSEVARVKSEKKSRKKKRGAR